MNCEGIAVHVSIQIICKRHDIKRQIENFQDKKIEPMFYLIM